MTGVSLARSVDKIEAQLTSRIGGTISSEVAVTLFGIGMGVSTAIAQLLAARRLNSGGLRELRFADLIPSYLLALFGLIAAATVLPGGPIR